MVEGGPLLNSDEGKSNSIAFKILLTRTDSKEFACLKLCE